MIQGNTPLRQVIRLLDDSALQIVLVVDEKGGLCGTITDGDIRRAILKGLTLDEPARTVMNRSPTVATQTSTRESIIATMRQKRLHHIPVVDDNRHIVALETLDELIQTDIKPNAVVLMAGGLGSRLSPLTDDCPKPMLPIGNQPLLQTIIESFVEYGFRRFFLSVNYMADLVEEYFRDGSEWGIEIEYLRENERLGTAGALSLIRERQHEPLIVMNGDVLTKVNFKRLLDFHVNQRAMATMCVREYDFQVPYGVVRLQDQHILGIDEKPVQRFFVNAGIYVIQPEVLNLITPGQYTDMTTLFEAMIELKQETVVFPIREYWLDIGQIADYDRAKGEFKQVFK
jgi:dTDP-glucose pyrophosphorylase